MSEYIEDLLSEGQSTKALAYLVAELTEAIEGLTERLPAPPEPPKSAVPLPITDDLVEEMIKELGRANRIPSDGRDVVVEVLMAFARVSKRFPRD